MLELENQPALYLERSARALGQASKFPGSTLSLYANVGHLPWIEQPKRFFAEVAQFLGEAHLQS
jgi:pimeloyl-ACP methyl ester carboxylesterase